MSVVNKFYSILCLHPCNIKRNVNNFDISFQVKIRVFYQDTAYSLMKAPLSTETLSHEIRQKLRKQWKLVLYTRKGTQICEILASFVRTYLIFQRPPAVALLLPFIVCSGIAFKDERDFFRQGERSEDQVTKI
jgi:hypothetical protein